jgi:hypothetical protein
MKKLILYVALLATVTSMSSCYKTWTCACKISIYDGNDPIPDVTYVHAEVIGFKRDAKNQCDAGDDTEDYGGGDRSTTECSLSE